MLTGYIHPNDATADEPRCQESVDHELRVLVVDDHPAVRAGLLQLLEEQPDLTVVDAVGSAEAAMSMAERESIDVAVVDYQLGSRSGLWLSRMLKRLEPAPRVVVYSAYCDGPLAAACVVAEADGLVSKGGVGAELCDEVRAVARGRSSLPPVPPALAGAMRRRLDSEDQAIFGMLLAGIEPGRDRGDAQDLAGGSGRSDVGDASQARGAGFRACGRGSVRGPSMRLRRRSRRRAGLLVH